MLSLRSVMSERLDAVETAARKDDVARELKGALSDVILGSARDVMLDVPDIEPEDVRDVVKGGLRDALTTVEDDADEAISRVVRAHVGPRR